MGTALRVAPVPTRTLSRPRETRTWRRISRAWISLRKRPWSRRRISDVGNVEPAASVSGVHEVTRNPKSDIRNPSSHPPHPDIPITHGRVVILQRQWLLRLMRLVGLDDAVRHLPDDLLMMLRHHAAIEHRHVLRLGQLSSLQ